MFLKADTSIKDEFGFWPIDYLDMCSELTEDEQNYMRSLLVKGIDKKKEKFD